MAAELSRKDHERRLRIVSEREQNPAMAGGREWREFVAWAEGVLGEPWATIREDLNALHRKEAVS